MRNSRDLDDSAHDAAIEERFIAQNARDGAEYLDYASRDVRSEANVKRRRRLAPLGMTVLILLDAGGHTA